MQSIDSQDTADISLGTDDTGLALEMPMSKIDGGLILEMSMRRIDGEITVNMSLRSHGKKTFYIGRKTFPEFKKKLLRKSFYENSLVKDQKVPKGNFDEFVLKRLQNKLSNKT